MQNKDLKNVKTNKKATGLLIAYRLTQVKKWVHYGDYQSIEEIKAILSAAASFIGILSFYCVLYCIYGQPGSIPDIRSANDSTASNESLILDAAIRNVGVRSDDIQMKIDENCYVAPPHDRFLIRTSAEASQIQSIILFNSFFIETSVPACIQPPPQDDSPGTVRSKLIEQGERRSTCTSKSGEFMVQSKSYKKSSTSTRDSYPCRNKMLAKGEGILNLVTNKFNVALADVVCALCRQCSFLSGARAVDPENMMKSFTISAREKFYVNPNLSVHEAVKWRNSRGHLTFDSLKMERAQSCFQFKRKYSEFKEVQRIHGDTTNSKRRTAKSKRGTANSWSYSEFMEVQRIHGGTANSKENMRNCKCKSSAMKSSGYINICSNHNSVCHARAIA
uniref:Uncharacterized protein n=1 Tax=Glossina pallidipes TaxID=7398 RepID=A0A1B0AGW6_GLOPL